MAALGSIGLSGSVAWIIDHAVHGKPNHLWPWLIGISGIMLRFSANLWRGRLSQSLSARMRTSLREKLIAQATHLGPHWLNSHGNAAWWSQHLLEQVDALHGYLSRYLPARQAALFIPLVMIAITLSVDWVAGLLMLLATPIIPIFMVLIGWGTEAVHRSQQEQQASLAANLLDHLQALPWIRRVGGLTEAQENVNQSAVTYRQLSMKVLRVAFLSSATLELFSALSIGLMAIYIGFALLGMVNFGPAPDLMLASGLFMLMLAPEIFLPLRQLAQAHHDMLAARASAHALIPLVSEQPLCPLSQFDQPEKDCHTIELVDVSMHWPRSIYPLLDRVNLNVKRGEILGIAGDSGQGKTTLVNLIAGFISPTKGTIRRDPHAAWVDQRPHLLHATLRENLLLGCQSNANDETLTSALTHVGLKLPNDTLPHGLDTQIGESNRGVSGGQAQRIALCRAILSGYKLWILDEPTAALDEYTRDNLLDFMFSHAKDHYITILISSHDRHVLSRCDRIVRLDRGTLQVDA